ncbi:MAG: ribose 5-phosphate isomerase B [Ezakiella sp.]|nr:ribose 5-phosphate isomerase B [Ezakiella sp.]MDD7762066.1 ribose 5-phosphate isomerase B [Bacillota bacterium]MDY3946988.1 ribose 5-phosphate isomerase B [Ezakiella sp.]
MKIGFGSDHGGYDLKNAVMKHVAELGHDVFDFGSFEGERVDYPDYAKKVCEAVVARDVELGMLFCGTGIGISIAANKVNGIRCALLGDSFSARMAKEHNNANVIAMGGRVIGDNLAIDMVDQFLNAEFQGERHQKRLDKIKKMEE